MKDKRNIRHFRNLFQAFNMNVRFAMIKALNEGGFADYFDGKDKVRAAVEAVLAKYYDVFHTA